MTIEMQAALERELNDAKSIESPERRHEAIEMVQSHMLAALIDCQRKTAERVKELVAREDAQKHERRGMAFALEGVRLLAAAGGGAGVLKALSLIGIGQ